MTTTYTIKKGDTLSGLSKQYGTTIAELQKLNPSITDINKIYAGANLIVPTPVTSKEQIETGIAQITPKIEELGKQIAQKQAEILPIKEIPSEPTIKDLTKGAVIKPPVLSEEKPSVTDQFTKSLLENLENQRKLSEQTYQKQIDEANKKAEEVKKQLSEVTAKQEKILTTDIEPLTQPFRETLEKSERERLKIEENYFANQQLTSELEGLLTDIQNQVKIEKEQTGLASIRTPTIAKSAEDMTARVGVIEAVMATRNNQISVAENLIDRTSTAIATDRKDQLSYYQTLFNFYQQERDETGTKLLSLEKEEKEYIQKKISLIENDLTQAQKSANYIKDLMVNPSSADLMAKAGIKLTDTVEEINSKMNEQVYKDEIVDLSKEMVKEGYQSLTPEIAQTKPEQELIKIPDSRGKEQIFWKKPETKIVSIQGGLYDVTNKKWIVEPKEEGNATFLNEKTGQNYDLGTVAGLKQFKIDNPDYSYEDMNAFLDQNVTGLDSATRKNLLEGAGYLSSEESKVTMSDFDMKNYVKENVLKGKTKEDLMISFSNDKNMSEATKQKFSEIIDEILPQYTNSMLEEARNNPDIYQIRKDGIYKKVIKRFWPDKWELVVDFNF